MTEPTPAAETRQPELQRRALAWLFGTVPSSGPDVAAAAEVSAAVSAWVDRLPGIRRTDAGLWDDDTWQGAVMLTARLIRRRNSPAGIETWTSDAATYVSRSDPDVAVLLRLGPNAAPQVG